MFEQARAVIIAVDNYDDSNIMPLKFACKDANDLKEQLLDNGFRENNISIIADETGASATRSQIYSAIVQLAKELRAVDKKLSDLVLIFFSGHSWYEEDVFDLSPFEQPLPGEDWRSSRLVHYLLPRDARIDNLGATAVPLEHFKRMVNSLRASQVALLLDACYSGIKGHKGIKGQFDETILAEGLGEGRVLIASSTGTQPSFEYEDLGNGAFTHFLLEALRGKAGFDKNGLINHASVGTYVYEQVVAYSRQKGRIQTPNWTTQIERPPGIVLAVNSEAYFLYRIKYPQENRYLGDRVKLALQKNPTNGRTDLQEIRALATKFIGNRFDIESLMNEICDIDREYLSKLHDEGNLGEVHFERIKSSQDNPDVTRANGQIEVLTQEFLCEEIALPDFIAQIDTIDITYIKNEIDLPFSPQICDSFTMGFSNQPEQSSVHSEVQTTLRQICAGQMDSHEGQTHIIDIARKGLVRRYPHGGELAKNLSEVLEWSRYGSNPILGSLIEWIWQILLDKFNPEANKFDRDLINNAIEEFEKLSSDLREKFERADKAVVEGDYQTAITLFNELANKECPPPRILFGDRWDSHRRKLSLKANLRAFALDGNYSEIAQALGNVRPVFLFSQKLREIVKQGYLSDPFLLFFESQNPYKVLEQYGIYFNSSQKEIKDLMMVQEREAYNMLRKVEGRLVADWQIYPVYDAEFLEKFAKDAETKLSLPSYEQLRNLATDDNVMDIFIILVVADARDKAHLFLEEILSAHPLPATYGQLCHFLGLSYFAEAIASNNVQDKITVNQFHKAIAYLTINLANDAFWEEFKHRRQKVYDVEVLKANIDNGRKKLKTAINQWFVERTNACGSGQQEHDAEIYNELRLKFEAEIAGADLLQKVGGIKLESDPSKDFIGGYLSVELFRRQAQLEEVIFQQDIAEKLTHDEQKLFPCLFSEYNAVVILRNENPSEALKQMSFVVEFPDHPRHFNFVQLAVDTEIQLANDAIGSASFAQREITDAINHWQKAYALSAKIGKEDVTRILIVNQIAGRVKHLHEQSQKISASGRFREAIRSDQIAISFIESVLDQLFDAPDDKEFAASRLTTPLANFYRDIGVDLCNHIDDFHRGARFLRRAVDLNPFVPSIRTDFLRALLNAADHMLLSSRKAESRIFYQEAKEVAEVGIQKAANRSMFTELKERAERGLKGKIDYSY